MSLRDHYLERARAYRDSVERQDNDPIDDDPVRATLLLAIMEADFRRATQEDVADSNRLAAERADRSAERSALEVEQLLDALLSLKPPFPGNGSDPYADQSLRPGLNKPTEDAANVR